MSLQKFYKGSATIVEEYTCPCGYKFQFESGDDARAVKLGDLKVRLHNKKCPLKDKKTGEPKEEWVWMNSSADGGKKSAQKERYYGKSVEQLMREKEDEGKK